MKPRNGAQVSVSGAQHWPVLISANRKNVHYLCSSELEATETLEIVAME